jgi:hypothetical protein
LLLPSVALASAFTTAAPPSFSSISYIPLSIIGNRLSSVFPLEKEMTAKFLLMEQIWGASFGMREIAFFTEFITSSPNPHSDRPMKNFPLANVDSILAVK